MNEELIAIGERIRQQLPAYREAYAVMLKTGSHPSGMWPDAREIFTDLNDWFHLAILEPLPAELRPSVAKLGTLVAKGYPSYGFQEGVATWADLWEPVWEKAKGATVPLPGQWEYLGGNVWRKDGVTKRVRFGGEPSVVLAKLFALNPGEVIHLEKDTDAHLTRRRVLDNLKDLGISMGLTANLKEGSIIRLT